MRRLLLLAVVALWGAVAISCDKEDQKTWTLTVASRMGMTSDGVAPPASIPAYFTKEKSSDRWELTTTIVGFQYQAGYEYRILVGRKYNSPDVMDGSAWDYVFIRELSKVQKESEGLPEGVK